VTEKTYRQSRYRRPTGSTELFVVRHGESEPASASSVFPLVDGHGDPALAPEGWEQAERVADRLAGEALDAIYVSTLRRTVQTAAPLAARTGSEPIVEPDVREVFLGEWEGGRFRHLMAEGGPVVDRFFAEERWDVIPGAESAEAFSARIGEAFGRIIAANPGGRVAVFTHGGVIAELLAQASGGGRAFAFLGLDNGSISQLVWTGRWVVRRTNDTSHLRSGFDDPPLGDGSSGASA
jgi:probable phosphoglycerate mutase